MTITNKQTKAMTILTNKQTKAITITKQPTNKQQTRTAMTISTINDNDHT